MDPLAFFVHFNPGVYTPPLFEEGVCKTYVYVDPADDHLMGLVIGKNGYYFKAITRASRTRYIWYNKQTHLIEIWGSAHCLMNAVQRIHRRIDLVKEYLSSVPEPMEIENSTVEEDSI
jgi:hypothetical protein